VFCLRAPSPSRLPRAENFARCVPRPQSPPPRPLPRHPPPQPRPPPAEISPARSLCPPTAPSALRRWKDAIDARGSPPSSPCSTAPSLPHIAPSRSHLSLSTSPNPSLLPPLVRRRWPTLSEVNLPVSRSPCPFPEPLWSVFGATVVGRAIRLLSRCLISWCVWCGVAWWWLVGGVAGNLEGFWIRGFYSSRCGSKLLVGVRCSSRAALSHSAAARCFILIFWGFSQSVLSLSLPRFRFCLSLSLCRLPPPHPSTVPLPRCGSRPKAPRIHRTPALAPRFTAMDALDPPPPPPLPITVPPAPATHLHHTPSLAVDLAHTPADLALLPSMAQW
jgi:hypothetical protein